MSEGDIRAPRPRSRFGLQTERTVPEKLSIAVADDDEQMRSYYLRILTDMGHEVTAAAEDGQVLLDACRADRPDIVITDIQMPDLDGIAAVTEICRDEPLPVILVSAYHDEELMQRATLEYILAYLVKPIKRHDLETAIALVMQRFRQFQSLRQEAESHRDEASHVGRARCVSAAAKACQREEPQARRPIPADRRSG